MLRAQARLCCLLICFLAWLVAATGNMAESGCKPVLLSSLSQSEPDSKFCPHVDIFGCAYSQRAPACPGGLSWRFPDIPAICFLAPWPPVLGALSRSVRLPSPSVPPIHFTPPLWNTSVCRKDQRKKTCLLCRLLGAPAAGTQQHTCTAASGRGGDFPLSEP